MRKAPALCLTSRLGNKSSNKRIQRGKDDLFYEQLTLLPNFLVTELIIQMMLTFFKTGEIERREKRRL